MAKACGNMVAYFNFWSPMQLFWSLCTALPGPHAKWLNYSNLPYSCLLPFLCVLSALVPMPSGWITPIYPISASYHFCVSYLPWSQCQVAELLHFTLFLPLTFFMCLICSGPNAKWLNYSNLPSFCLLPFLCVLSALVPMPSGWITPVYSISASLLPFLCVLSALVPICRVPPESHAPARCKMDCN